MTEPLPQRLSRWLAWVAGAVILFGCAVPITIDVAMRYFFNQSAVDSFEISSYGLAICIGLGMAFTVTTKAHIRVDFLAARLPFPLRAACDLLAAFALALVAAALAWFAWGTLEQSWSMGARSMSQMRVPLVLPQGLWWIGLFWFACMAVLAPVQAVLRLIRGDRAGFDALVGSADLDAEIAEAVHASDGAP
ncbi:TRAP transporter small permease subunit [Sulfitobacter sp. G21635-S1]|uniref:TRAP transporter small permease subunit n=1 Tax=Sulfitobacter sp. G21635-S1 TaxID=3014043 RepID=UPI0022AF82B9|nr:TRAP transporter small permease subunit [Sulfitobacter sp. G21635-S1]MCZ4258245.1 TRAP transporter small permease subunit [Sulfitobacter sp. G21635-S1]